MPNYLILLALCLRIATSNASTTTRTTGTAARPAKPSRLLPLCDCGVPGDETAAATTLVTDVGKSVTVVSNVAGVADEAGRLAVAVSVQYKTIPEQANSTLIVLSWILNCSSSSCVLIILMVLLQWQNVDG